MKYTEPGTYHLVYKAVDECGNESEKRRTVVAEEVPVETEAYAKYNSSTKTFTLFRDTAGKYTDGQVVGDETFYNNMESRTIESVSQIPWSAYRQTITKVVIKDDISPVSTRFLFSGFTACTSITGLEKLNTSKTTDMTSMFNGCSLLTSIDVSHFDTSSATSMANMFGGCSSLTSLDLSSFDTSNVTSMSRMFNMCEKLTSLDLSSFNTSNVTNMGSMFDGCLGLTSVDVSRFNTSAVTNMSYMFANVCTQDPGIVLNVSNFDTSNVTNMSHMFWQITATSLDLSSFSTSKVTNASDMFGGIPTLKTIYVSDNFVLSSTATTTRMFEGSYLLVGGAGTRYNMAKIDGEYARIDNPPDAPGYFTRKE